MGGVLFFWTDWDDECEPPEPGKAWLTIRDPEGEEFAIIVHRFVDGGTLSAPSPTDEARMVVKEGHAQTIVNALNAWHRFDASSIEADPKNAQRKGL